MKLLLGISSSGYYEFSKQVLQTLKKIQVIAAYPAAIFHNSLLLPHTVPESWPGAFN